MDRHELYPSKKIDIRWSTEEGHDKRLKEDTFESRRRELLS